VPASTLIEVVLGPETSAETADAARGWVSALGKTRWWSGTPPGSPVRGSGGHRPGGDAHGRGGVASPEDIDTAMVLGYKHPVGPLRTTDLVGLDVRLGIAEYLASTLGERFSPPQILRDKVARGELGRKSGKGFFEWID
jgi:3-hydroxybutyryl-CoA dehydrogenase